MKMRLLASTLILATSLAQSATIFTDSFESGNLSASSPSGYRWGEINKTGVVSNTTATFGANLFSGTGWTAQDGAHSLRFQYPATNYISEQRFNLGGAYRDIWFRYWLRVPTNYLHGSIAGATNHKLFALWMDGYSNQGSGSTVIWEFWNNGSGGSNVAFHYQPSGGADGPHLQYAPFISTSDRGRWMEIVLRVKAATTVNSNDGIIQMWRRWDGQDSFSKIHELLNVDLGVPSSGPQGWNNGYFMGWTNAPYATNTEWLLDNLTISDENLLGSTPSATQSPPVAPALSVQPR